MSDIQIQNIEKNYGNQKVLRGLSLNANKGDQICIQGASGSGKSTLLYLLGALESCDKGKILVEGQDLSKLNDEKLARFRNSSIGFVFQFHFLLASMSCMENILLPAKIGNKNSKAVRERALKVAEILGVEDCLAKYPFQLSGGEQQRINIIRALSLRPSLLLCDEPTGNLDSENSKKVAYLISELAKEFEATLFFVTHDDKIASHFHNVINIKDGEFVS